MDIRPLRLAGTYEIRCAPQQDDRGHFMRTYDRALFARFGLATSWEQESQSMNLRMGTLRGLHFQRLPYTEAKLVQVVAGAVFDVFVDLRRSSETYGQWDSIELSDAAHNIVYIPKGFAHGFCTLSAETMVLYKMDAPYSPESQDGLIWSDPALNISWPTRDPVVSVRDQRFGSLADLASPF
jgi:dTDP-4-dehydrorhamnose 3,5-epimerase